MATKDEDQDLPKERTIHRHRVLGRAHEVLRVLVPLLEERCRQAQPSGEDDEEWSAQLVALRALADEWLAEIVDPRSIVNELAPEAREFLRMLQDEHDSAG